MNDETPNQGQPMPLALTVQKRTILEALQGKETEQYPLSKWYLGALYALENPYNPDCVSQAAQSLNCLWCWIALRQHQPLNLWNPHCSISVRQPLSPTTATCRTRHPSSPIPPLVNGNKHGYLLAPHVHNRQSFLETLPEQFMEVRRGVLYLP